MKFMKRVLALAIALGASAGVSHAQGTIQYLGTGSRVAQPRGTPSAKESCGFNDFVTAK